jgi:aspartyl/asparaginyl beta-hydroxylase (cupin superfamily)
MRAIGADDGPTLGGGSVGEAEAAPSTQDIRLLTDRPCEEFVVKWRLRRHEEAQCM